MLVYSSSLVCLMSLVSRTWGSFIPADLPSSLSRRKANVAGSDNSSDAWIMPSSDYGETLFEDPSDLAALRNSSSGAGRQLGEIPAGTPDFNIGFSDYQIIIKTSPCASHKYDVLGSWTFQNGTTTDKKRV